MNNLRHANLGTDASTWTLAAELATQYGWIKIVREELHKSGEFFRKSVFQFSDSRSCCNTEHIKIEITRHVSTLNIKPVKDVDAVPVTKAYAWLVRFLILDSSHCLPFQYKVDKL